jgi:hypothetical protein
MNIILALLTIPIISVAISAGMVLLKKVGIILGGVAWLILWLIPMVSLVAIKRVSVVDILISVIVYLVLSALMLFLTYKTGILLVGRWLRQFLTYKTGIALVESCLNSIGVAESQPLRSTSREAEQSSNSHQPDGNNFSVERERIDNILLTGSPGEPISLCNWFIVQVEEQEEWDFASISAQVLQPVYADDMLGSIAF